MRDQAAAATDALHGGHLQGAAIPKEPLQKLRRQLTHQSSEGTSGGDLRGSALRLPISVRINSMVSSSFSDEDSRKPLLEGAHRHRHRTATARSTQHTAPSARCSCPAIPRVQLAAAPLVGAEGLQPQDGEDVDTGSTGSTG